MYMYGGPPQNMPHYTYMVGSFIEACLLGSMKEGEECDYDHTWIDDSSA